MSNINVSRAVENIRANTTHRHRGGRRQRNSGDRREGRVKRTGFDQGIQECSTRNRWEPARYPEFRNRRQRHRDENRDSFDTLYSDFKIRDGGKGFGRFTCLKYFDRLQVESDYLKGDGYIHRSFRMGKGKEIIVDESNVPSTVSDSKTVVRLDWLRTGKSIDKRLDTVARILVEKLLPYFITSDYSCPRIVLSEADGSDAVVLNDFVSNQISSVIQEIPLTRESFELKAGEATRPRHDFADRNASLMNFQVTTVFSANAPNASNTTPAAMPANVSA